MSQSSMLAGSSQTPLSSTQPVSQTQSFTQTQLSSQATVGVVAFPGDPLTTPLADHLLAPLQTLTTLSQQLFASLAPASTRPPPPPPLAALVDTDAALASAVHVLRAHQAKQRRIEALKADVLALDARWRALVQELADGRSELDEMVREGDTRIKAIEEAKAAAIPYPELLAYAQSLSAFTSAPPTMPDLALPGQPPPPLFFPPFPNEEKMRRGRMNAEVPLERGAQSVKPAEPSPEPERAQHGPAGQTYRADLRAPQQQFFDLDLDLNPDL